MPLWKSHQSTELFSSNASQPAEPAQQAPANLGHSAPQTAARPDTTVASGHGVLVRGLSLRGDISGTDSLFIDGEIEGIVTIANERVTIGPNGLVHAPAGTHGPCIAAREILVLGHVAGAIYAGEKVEIRANGSVTGEISTVRISIEDGAFFRGGIDIRKPEVPDAQPVEPGPAQAESLFEPKEEVLAPAGA